MLYFIIGKFIWGAMESLRQVMVCYTYKRTARGILLTDPVAKRRTLFLVLSLSVCYPLIKVSGAEDES